jgi:aryl-alcohol dehydrogenase-like predicted oxidoreductase
MKPLGSYLDAEFGAAANADATLAQRTLRALLGTPGVDVALVGMRRPAYVRDVLGAFA